MRRFAWIALAIVLLAGVFSGCTGEKAYVKEDTRISVKAGESFTIKLDENPTTGYRWSYSISDEKVLKLKNDDYAPEPGSENRAGAGGTRVLTFEARLKGNAVINMVYERSFDKNENDEKLIYQVEVK